ncbi:hypothetical protein G6F35_015833 [Rhizopus arrhizus]|nr:hypothetical protein G6F35_015833 [Rhizopus arrhizus]
MAAADTTMKAATWRGVKVNIWPSAPSSVKPSLPAPWPCSTACTNFVRGIAQNRLTHSSASVPSTSRKVERSRSRSNSVRSTYSLP